MSSVRFALVVLIALLCGSAWAADDEFTIKTTLYSLTLSNGSGVIRTTKMEAWGAQLLAEPSVEFLIDLDINNEPVTLIPSDFEVKGMDQATVGNETRTSFKLQCKRDELPIVAHLRFITNPDLPYLQKYLIIEPSPKAKGAVLRRVTLECCRLKPEFVPFGPADPQITPAQTGAGQPSLQKLGSSQFVAVDPKAKKGLFFFTASLFGSESYDLYGGLVMAQDYNQPLEQGCETGRAAIGFVSGPPEVVYKRFRDYLWQNCCAVKGKMAQTLTEIKTDEPDGAKSAERFAALQSIQKLAGDARTAKPGDLLCLRGTSRPAPKDLHRLLVVDQIAIASTDPAAPARQMRYWLSFFYPPRTLLSSDAEHASVLALRTRFPALFDVYQHVLGTPDGKRIDGEAHIVNGSGFIVLYNPSTQPQMTAIPLGEPELELKGDLKLTDWTDPAAPAALRTSRVSDTVETTVDPGAVRIIGVNITPAG